MEDLWKYIRVYEASGKMAETPQSDNREEITNWQGYKIYITTPSFDTDIDEEKFEQQYPGIMDVAYTYWFYRRGFHGSPDLVHFAFANYDPGNDYDIYNVLHNAGVILLIDEIQQPKTFLEMLLVYVDKYGSDLVKLTKAREVYQLGDVLPLDVVHEILKFR